MNQIKNKLKNLANKQEIHDLSNDIINSVDKSKVKANTPVVKSPKYIFRFIPLLAASAAVVALMVGFSVSSIGNNPVNNQANIPTNIPYNPNNPINNGGDVTTTIKTINLYEDTLEAVEFVKKSEIQSTYKLANIATSISNVTFDTVALSDSKQLIVAEEEAIVNDVYAFIYNLEYMLGLSEVAVSDKNNNTSADYNYKYDTLVNTPYYDYHIYYDEELIEEVETSSNYKSKTVMNGILKFAETEYNLSTTQVIKNSIVEYNTSLKLDQNSFVTITEKYGLGENIFTYVYSKDDLTKTITIKQNLDTEGNTKQINFNIGLINHEDIKMEIKPTNDVILCKIKGRDDNLSISKENNNYIFKFNKSTNIYQK